MSGRTFGGILFCLVAAQANETELMRRSHIEKKVQEFREALNLPLDMPSAQSSAKKATKDN